jgi:hypothetical protein
VSSFSISFVDGTDRQAEAALEETSLATRIVDSAGGVAVTAELKERCDWDDGTVRSDEGS